MHILLISPYLPPDRGGVSDHTQLLASEMLKQGNSIQIITFCENPRKITGVNIESIPRDSLQKKELYAKIESIQADHIIIQFTPFSFSEKFYGIALWLPFFLYRLKKRSSASISIIVHESSYPINPNPRGILIGIPHFIQFSALILVSHHMFFSHIANLKIWARRFSWKKHVFSVLPTFSNINIENKLANIRKRFEIEGDAKILFYFGGAHDTNLLSFVIKTFNVLYQKYPEQKICLVMAGVSEAIIKKKYAISENPNIKILGYLSSEEISSLYQEAEIILAPFSEGITTRRSSAMAALLHGKALATTSGWCTCDDQPWKEITAICDVKEPEVYTLLVEDLLLNPEKALSIGKKAQSYYRDHFSTELAAKSILSVLKIS